MAQTDVQVSATSIAAPADMPLGQRLRRRQTFLDRFVRHRSATLGALILLLVLGVAVFTPLLMNHDPTLAVPQARFMSPGATAEAPASGTYVLGTDNLGRDVYSRVVKGSQVSLEVGLGVSLATVLSGTIIGLVAGYFKRLD